MLESRGPVIYHSKRVGTGYQVFDFLKFRSMYNDADQRLKDLMKFNQYAEDGLFVKFNNDPRITIVGKFIRKTSLDELPQLINVLKGDMSIVGNRPLPVYEAELLTRDLWAKRFLAPAGLTGLWQVTKRGKNNMSSEERINLDVTYAENHSFWYDLKIMFKTPFALIQDENV
jgi:lipopolysaccharide/colanic/teichoic acid biosynthesis glycosyltransferase